MGPKRFLRRIGGWRGSAGILFHWNCCSIYGLVTGIFILLVVIFLKLFSVPCISQFREKCYAAAISGPHCPARSQWYGTSAYPTVDGRNQSWSWLMAFVQSVENTSSADVAAWQIFLERATDDDSLTLDSVRFPGVLSSGPEKYIFDAVRNNGLPSATQMRVWDMDRTECFTKLCDKKSHPKIILRNDPPDVAGDVVFVNFRDVDVYDVEKIINQLFRTHYVVTSCIAEFPITLHDEDTGLALYDMLNKMYFEWDWIPILSDTSQCVNVDSRSCQFWIIWKRWNKQTKLSFIPPAGSGSPEYEIQRLSAFVTRPYADACSRKQRIGGSWEKFGFVDGQWTICLEHFQKTIASDSCLVYSFGVGDDWSFDDTMHEIGCRVYSFDPSINIASYQRNKNHWFYNWGLVTGTRRHPKWMLFSYDEIRRRLGHEGQRVTILKMDVEGAEWTFLNASNVAMRLADIDQFVLEIHTPMDAEWRNGVSSLSLLLHTIEKNGFVLFNSRINPLGSDLRAYSHKKFFMGSKQILAELSYIRCRGH